jgi:hypothetical protein
VTVDSGESFATLTHARLRAAQGDVSGAARILRVILDVQPGHAAARELLADIERRVTVVSTEPEDVVPEPVSPATAAALSLRFRGALGDTGENADVVRLARWLSRVRQNRDGRHAR